MALRHLLPLLLCLNACQTGQSRCHILPLIPAESEVALPELAPPCVWLTHVTDRPKAPSGLATLPELQRQQFMRQILESERLFFEGDPEQARGSLQTVYDSAVKQPELLPSSPKERTAAYRVLVTWMRLQLESGDTKAAQEVATWLAAHMPDQEPSVRTMPPELEVIASKALEKVRHAAVNLTVESPTGCPGQAQVYADGLALGVTPLQTRLAAGRHALWLQCDSVTSWVRIQEVTAGWHLAGVAMETESRVVLHDGQVMWWEASAAEADAALLRSLASWSGSEAIAAPAGESEWILATPTQTRIVPLPKDEALSLDSLVHHQEALPWWAGALGVTAAALAGSGVWAHMEADDATRQTNSGIRDLRSETSQWQDAATGLYAAAAVTATCAAGLLVWQLLTTPTPAEPLFR